MAKPTEEIENNPPNDYSCHFDELRTTLMDEYSSQITNHAGYITAIAVAFFAVFSNKDFLFLQLPNPLYWIPVGFDVLVFVLMFASHV
jgi:hypothetical protein